MPMRAKSHYERQGRAGEHKAYHARKQNSEADRFRSSQRWVRMRNVVISEQPICFDPFGYHCEDRTGEATEHIHHIKSVVKRPDLKLVRDNLIGLCRSCHGKVEAMEIKNKNSSYLFQYTKYKPSLIPLTIVCGAPCSGKTTYVEQVSKPNDLVLDLDKIRAELSGEPMYQNDGAWLQSAIEYRDNALIGLSDPNELNQYAHAYLIVTAARLHVREKFRKSLKPLTILVMPTLEHTCLARLEADQRRRNKYLTRKAITGWFTTYAARGANV